MTETARNDLCRFEESDGFRRRLVATSLIPKGTRIFSESPSVTLPRLLYMYGGDTALISQIRLLSEEEQDHLPSVTLSLDGKDPADYLPPGLVHDAGDHEFGLFLKMYHVSHSCIQNAHRSWNSDLGQLTLHAIRDIAAGEEITVNRMEGRCEQETRAAVFDQNFHFICSCPLCSVPEKERATFDVLFDEITVLSQLAQSATACHTKPLANLETLRKLVLLLQRDDFPGLAESNTRHLAWLYQAAAALTMSHSDVLRTKIFAKRASIYYETMSGADNPATIEMKEAALNPKACSGFGYTDEWNTEHEMQPPQDDTESFDRWLWRIDDPKILQFADLRSQLFFPTFQQLPHEGMPSYAYHKVVVSNEGRDEPRPFKSWCFLGEISASGKSDGLEARVIDKVGDERTVRVFRGQEKEFEAKGCGEMKPGHTLAVLYAVRSDLRPGQEGIWMMPSRARVFPLSLDELLSLSDNLKLYGTKSGNVQICHGCEKHSTILKPCPECGMFWYCNQDCLAFAWKERGHNQECKHLNDKSLNSMFLVTWNNYEYHFMFPLYTEEETEAMRQAIRLKLKLDEHEKAKKQEQKLLKQGE